MRLISSQENKLQETVYSIMKFIYKIAFACTMIAALASSCAKVQTSSTYEANKRYYDAWISTHHPDAKMIGESVAVISDTEGKGKSVADSNFILVNFTARYLDGTIAESTREDIAKQLGTLTNGSYYGSQIWHTTDDALTVGVERGILGSHLIKDSEVKEMKIGGKRTFTVPRWLCGKTRRAKESDYLSNSTNTSNDYIYEIEIEDAFNDVTKWQIDSMERYSAKYLNGLDTLKKGFYYKRLKEPSDTSKFSNDTTIYINYIGRLLNGTVFDTNIADSAKMHKIYSSTREYGPSEVTWNEEVSNIKLGESSVIGGWSLGISMMRAHEKAMIMFYSDYGYGISGSGESIPPYAPLIFEIEIVDNPNE